MTESTEAVDPIDSANRTTTRGIACTGFVDTEVAERSLDQDYPVDGCGHPNSAYDPRIRPWLVPEFPQILKVVPGLTQVRYAVWQLVSQLPADIVGYSGA